MEFIIIVKPETLCFCKENLREHLIQNSFIPLSEYSIKDWNVLSLELYSKSEKLKPEQFHLQNIGRNQLLGDFGNLAQLWVLSADYKSQEEGYSELTKLKYSFRSKMWVSGLNIYFEKEGVKTPYHYSYFHVPDPFLDSIERECKLMESYIC